MSQDVKICPQCDTEVNIDSKFCMNCGHKFSTQEIEEVNEKPEETTVNEVDEETTQKQEETKGTDNEPIDISQYFDLFDNIGETTDYAVSAVKESDWHNALTFIDQSIDNNSSNSDLWALKSFILFKLEYFEDAITSVNISLSLNDFSELAWACKAVILDSLGENLAAISCCNEFLSLNPTNGKIIQLKLDLNERISSGVRKPVKEKPKVKKPEPESPKPITSTNIPVDDNVNPWDSKPAEIQSNPWQNGEIKDNNPWDLEINPNDNYNFTGEFDNHLTDFRDIFTVENRRKLENVHLTPTQYKNILNKIKTTSDDILNKTIQENNIDFASLSILEKILLFTKSFADVDYKAVGADLGNYAFNTIHLDDRLNTADQITTLIHELAHHLLAEIFEQATMVIFNSDKTNAIESYVGFSLMCADPSILLNEYCAHTVEGRFTPHGYQNYGSFQNILNRFDINRDIAIIGICMRVGNTFCQELLSIFEAFIDYNLREEIKQQFKKDYNYPPNYQGIGFEIKETIDIKELLDFINFILLTGFNAALTNPERLFEFRRQFELHDKKGGI